MWQEKFQNEYNYDVGDNLMLIEEGVSPNSKKYYV